MPAGAEPLFEADDLAEIEAYARKNDLTQDEAQAGLVEMANARVATLAKLDAQLKADVDYGGTKLSETQRLVKTVVDRVRPADHPRRAAFERMMARSGAGNHIEAVSFLADLGRMMSEDQPHLGGGGGGGGRPPAAEVLYGGAKK